MVHLLPKSPVPLHSTTLTHWDTSVRHNFTLYQTEIDRVTYALQKSQRGWGIFGSWLYPAFLQREVQNLQILKNK
jgi:hypothetical protein